MLGYIVGTILVITGHSAMSKVTIIPTEAVYADNCGACGKEFTSIELVPVKLGSFAFSRIKICVGCLVEAPEICKDYEDAVELIRQMNNKLPVD